MSRLEKKCLLGSAAMHGLLVVIFLFGSAFFTPKPKRDTLPVISFLPDKLVDQMLYGGGNPNVQPLPQPPPAPPPPVQAQPLPPPPEPQPKPQPPPEPVRPKEAPKPATPAPQRQGDEPTPTKLKDTPNKQVSRIPTNVVKFSQFDSKARQAQADKQARDRAAANAQAQAQYRQTLSAAARAAASAVSGLGSSLSGNTVSVEAPGPGGYAFANYGQWVKSVYDNAWVVTDDLADDDSTVKVRVTIARDGTVLSALIIAPSPNNALNKSVQRVLDDVKSIDKSFPDGAKEDQRTFTINFNLKAKRGLG